MDISSSVLQMQPRIELMDTRAVTQRALSRNDTKNTGGLSFWSLEASMNPQFTMIKQVQDYSF